MCGIAGIVEFANKPIEATLLLAMNQAIAHRGPDDEGYVLIDERVSGWRCYAGPGSASAIRRELPLLRPGTVPEGNIGLAHCRFSIIDLSAAGHQPFFDSGRSCCVVFNGEIYNYLEVREELAAKGACFETQSDTEVLLEAYKQWGTECFSKLNGFWAIALYDFNRKQLVLSRDRIGKKPLYWTKVGTRVYFASEIKALLRIPEVHRQRKVNEESIGHWLLYGRKDLNFATCFEGINSLPSACCAVLTPDFPRDARTFWSVPKQRLSESDISIADAVSELRTTLQDAVRIRLRADVPLSVELSGGMDSSTLVALAAQLQPGKITTYTVRFAEREWNEEPFARSVGLRYGTDYQVLEPSISNFWSDILPFTLLEEEPYHSPNLRTNQVIWSQMRARGTKVSLNGAGGDENFAGYGGYFGLFQLENLLERRFSAYFSNAFKYSQGRSNLRGLTRPFLKLAADAIRRRAPHFFSSNGKGKHFLNNGYRHTACLEPLRLSEALHSDMTNTLMPYWLRSGDRGFMGVPLEVRAPFLDYRVIEFAFRLPLTYLIRDGWHKWILRKTVEDLLPPDVVWRRRKLGFPFPYERFFSASEPIIELIRKHSQNPYVDLSKPAELRSDWNKISFVLWYELFFNENVPLFEKIEAKARRNLALESGEYRPRFLACSNSMR